MKLTRRTMMLSALVAPLAGHANARELTLAEISDYLNRTFTMTADFTQVNSDGSRTSGKFTMLRPGRMRFDYDPPDESLVIAGRSRVALFDARSNQGPQKFQLANTPLKILLLDSIDLTKEPMVVGHDYVDGQTVVTAQDPKRPEYGYIQLFFDDGPVLSHWIVTDGGGNRTAVSLSNIKTGMRLPWSLFDVEAALKERGF